MEQNKTRTYLFYATGEIFLVVLGILIALQINNWNEDRKELQIADDIRSSLTNDINSDLSSYETLRALVNDEINKYDSLQLKLTNPEVTEGQVISFIKDQFSPYIRTFEGFNDNSYRTASSSGTINFIKDSERTVLYKLYTKQVDPLQKFNNYEMFYLEALSNFSTYYPLKVPFSAFRSGPVYDKKWNNADFDDLTSRFNNVGSSKRNYYRILLFTLDEIDEQSRIVLQELKK